MSDETYKSIGVLVERQRAYGRRFCEGAASFACECPGISLGMLEWSDLKDPRRLSGYDAFIVRVLGWNEKKKNATLSAPSSAIYGCVSRDDVNRINAELLAVAGVLSNYEVVAEYSGNTI
jgi:hypothetical protein